MERTRSFCSVHMCLEGDACSVLGIRPSQPSTTISEGASAGCIKSHACSRPSPNRSHATCCTSRKPLCGSARRRLHQTSTGQLNHSEWQPTHDARVFSTPYVDLASLRFPS